MLFRKTALHWNRAKDLKKLNSNRKSVRIITAQETMLLDFTGRLHVIAESNRICAKSRVLSDKADNTNDVTFI
ncbi:MAG: hypothetical protein NC120_11385 [Ruminococcus sp.]|nr:hypothetical protein [Ruminococcus sp.]